MKSKRKLSSRRPSVSAADLPTARKLISRIREEPLRFVRDYLGETLDPQQIAPIEAIRDNKYIAIKSGHSAGKDFIAARLGLWFYSSYYPSIVIITGPTDRQAKVIVWGEVRKAYRRAAELNDNPIGGEWFETVLKSGDPDHYMMPFTTDQADSYQGFHAPNVMVIVTEATGMAPGVWTGIESLMTAKNAARMIVIGNPTTGPGDKFYDIFHSKRGLWKCFTLNSRRSTHCSQSWVEEREREWGKDSMLVRCRIDGEFPDRETDALIELAWIEAAQRRYPDVLAAEAADAPRSLGVDVARFGNDDSAFAEMIGIRVPPIETQHGNGLMTTCGVVVRRIKDGPIPAAHVRIDDTGLGGGVTDRLHEQDLDVVPVNFGSAALDRAKFKIVRDEIFWALRERFREGTIAIDPDDDMTVRDLCALRAKPDSSGRIVLEKKIETKERLGYSPDRADALALAAMGMQLAAHAREVFRGAPGERRPRESEPRVLSRSNFRSGLRITQPRRPRR